MIIITLLDMINVLLIIFFGLATSKEDLKYGRIKNENILLMISLGLFLFLLKIFFFTLLGGRVNLTYVEDYLLNIFLMTVSVFYFWSRKFLNAGDSKLIIAYTFLIPINFYRYGYVRFFPGLALLINIFTPIFIYLSFLLLKYSTKHEKINALKKSFNLHFVVVAYMALIGFMWLVRVIIPILKFKYSFSLSLILILLLMVGLSKLKRSTYIVISIFLLRLLFKQFPSIKELETDTLIILFLFFVRVFLLNLASVRFKKVVSIDELEPGMIILINHKEFNNKKVTLRNKKNLIETLKGLNLNEVEVKVPTAFAHYVFFGVVLTILCRGDIFSFLRFILFKH